MEHILFSKNICSPWNIRVAKSEAGSTEPCRVSTHRPSPSNAPPNSTGLQIRGSKYFSYDLVTITLMKHYTRLILFTSHQSVSVMLLVTCYRTHYSTPNIAKLFVTSLREWKNLFAGVNQIVFFCTYEDCLNELIQIWHCDENIYMWIFARKEKQQFI